MKDELIKGMVLMNIVDNCIVSTTQYILSEKGLRESVDLITNNIQNIAPSIDKVTVRNLDLAFRMVVIKCDYDTVDKIIDLVEIIENKGDLTTMKDICNIQTEWEQLND